MSDLDSRTSSLVPRRGSDDTDVDDTPLAVTMSDSSCEGKKSDKEDDGPSRRPSFTDNDNMDR